jgi:hypothetical protein
MRESESIESSPIESTHDTELIAASPIDTEKVPRIQCELTNKTRMEITDLPLADLSLRFQNIRIQYSHVVRKALLWALLH